MAKNDSWRLIAFCWNDPGGLVVANHGSFTIQSITLAVWLEWAMLFDRWTNRPTGSGSGPGSATAKHALGNLGPVPRSLLIRLPFTSLLCFLIQLGEGECSRPSRPGIYDLTAWQTHKHKHKAAAAAADCSAIQVRVQSQNPDRFKPHRLVITISSLFSLFRCCR